MTRFSVLPDDRRLLLGVDKSNIFEAGCVYEATVILDTIVIKKIGPYSLAQTGFPSELSEPNHIILYGDHLTTKQEVELLKDEGKK
jgi:hypothetical protein